MDVIVHYPQSEAGIDALEKKVAAVHADIVIKYIDKLRCPKAQKIELVNSIMNKGSPR